jgi:putative ABC transport system permease protein
MSPRWRKIVGDVVQNQGRIAMMLVSIAVGAFTVAVISTAYIVLEREINRGYLATNPPSAMFNVDRLDDKAMAIVRNQDGIQFAEASGRHWGRIEVRPNEWLPLLLFVSPDVRTQHIGTVNLEAGNWPDNADGIVIERTALPLAQSTLGGTINVQTPNGIPHKLAVTGVAHDAGVAPAWQQQTVYGYITPATLRLLGENDALRSLKIAINKSNDSPDESNNPIENRLMTERIAVSVAEQLKHNGYSVGEIRIPARQHPHWGLMRKMVIMLLIFSALTLLLSAVLTATLTASMLAPQVRQIGMMRAIGARSSQIFQLYAGLILAIGIIAVGIALPLGIFAGRRLADYVAYNQNLDVSNFSVSPWIYLVQMLAGAGIPLLLAFIPIFNATRRPIRETLSEYGVQSPRAAAGKFLPWTSQVMRLIPMRLFPMRSFPALTLAVRNAVRRKTRLALTIGLLATAGALFITSMNILAAWKQNLIDARIDRHVDIEIRFAKPQPAKAVIANVASIAGVKQVEVFAEGAVAVTRRDGLSITRTFPDGGHGSLSVHAVPVSEDATSQFITPSVISGRWIEPANLEETVINQQALAFFPDAKVGDQIQVKLRGQELQLRIAGIIRERLTGATIYMSTEAYAQAVGEAGLTQALRIGLERANDDAAIRIAATIEQSLERAGFKVIESTSQVQVGRALAGHLFILIFILIMMSILMAIVGVLGLASAMATSVLERTREFAVLRAIGAGNGSILRTVIGEGLFMAALSVLVASVLSVPFTIWIATLIGTASLGPAMGVVLSATAIPLWLAIALASAALASGYPARRAARMTIRDALDYQ